MVRRKKKESAAQHAEGKNHEHEGVLYVEADEEVTSVIDRMRKSTSDELFVVIPSRALMLQSVVNLKLIKKEAAEMEKEVNIVTTDRKGMNLASQVGITVYQDLRTTAKKGFTTTAVGKEHGTEHHIEQAPVPVPEKSPKEHRPGRLAALKGKLKKNSRSPDGHEVMDVRAFVSAHPNRRILSLFIAVSLFLLIVIAYFILPQATVYVQAKTFIERPIERVTLADAELNQAELKINDDTLIASYPIETEIELTKTYSATGITSTGSDARGEVIMFNDSSSTQPLVSTTRLRSPEGLIFRIQRDVIISPRTSVNVEVIADKLDESGQVIGERGNLGPTRFTLPGIAGANRELVYAKNTEAFTGGATQVTSVIEQKDVDAALTNIIDELKGVAKQKLQSRLENENKTREAELQLLDSDEALQADVLDARVVGDVKPGDVLNEFQVYGKIKVFGSTYDKNEVIGILNHKLRTLIHPDQEVANADYDSMKLEFVSFDQNKMTKVNASMNYRLKYNISDDLMQQIKERILGKRKEEAEEYIRTLNEVGDVTIDTWPFWVQSIPGVAWNINIQEEEDIT